MTTDLYAKCPCGSGKKIKFCCKDIISDIERIERMLRGDQRSAALDKINKLLEKHPDRAALLCLKAQVLLEQQDVEDVTAVIERLLEVEPENPSALAMKATTLSLSGDLSGGLALLHRALRLSDGVLSKMVYRSYLSICSALIQQEEFISAYAHVLTMVSITKGQERTCVSMLMNLTSSERLPAIFQGLLISDTCPENVTWQREFDAAIDHYRRGDWSSCASMLEDMSKRILDEPVIVRNKAILQSWICQRHAAIKSFRQFAAIRGVDPLEAVEAEACAQILEPLDPIDAFEFLALPQDIDDADAVMEQLLSTDWIKSMPVQHHPDSDAPPPKGQFVVCDRDLPPTDDDYAGMAYADLPQEICMASVHGKQTDKSAQVVLLLFRDERFQATVDRIGELLGITIDVEQAEFAGQVPKVERLVRPAFLMPPSTPVEQRQAVQQEWMEQQFMEVWPTLTLSAFGDQSAVEAVKDRKRQKAVLGALLNLEIWMDRQPFELDFNRLRANLGLPIVEPLSPEGLNVRTLSPAKLLVLEIEKLTDPDLKILFEFLSVRPNGKMLYRLAHEILSRSSMHDDIDMIEVYERLASLAPTTDEALEHLKKGCDLAVSQGESPATWLISELDVRIQRDEVDQVRQLMSEIQTRYLREPGVGQMLSSVLAKYGLVTARPGAEQLDAVSGAMTEAPVPAAAPSGGIWTPDGGAADQHTPDSEEGESKLWVPD